jgi:hypothetical protein
MPKFSNGNYANSEAHSKVMIEKLLVGKLPILKHGGFDTLGIPQIRHIVSCP